ncbi:MAG: hypothetical protein Q8O56_13890 [Solirubrobacteraceae bacterium]|nr:hypothetical protein [Solirubrobacteraceae bacterium]
MGNYARPASGIVNAHNASPSTHADIRADITALDETQVAESAAREAADDVIAAAAASAHALAEAAGVSSAAHEALTTGAHGGIVADTDSRLSDARSPVAHAHSQSDVTGLPDVLSAAQAAIDAEQSRAESAESALGDDIAAHAADAALDGGPHGLPALVEDGMGWRRENGEVVAKPVAPDVQVFNAMPGGANQTWTKPQGATIVGVLLIQPGGGGGSGRRGAPGTPRTGGGGGGAGGAAWHTYRASLLNATEVVRVGQGQAGAPPVLTDNTDGVGMHIAGTGVTWFKSATFSETGGPQGGSGGSTSNVTGGAGGVVGGAFATPGGASSTLGNGAGGANVTNGAPVRPPTSGGAGGSMPSGNGGNGGAMGSGFGVSLLGGAGGVGSGAAGGTGNSPANDQGGTGGGGGAAGGTDAPGGNGGDGGFPGGGGGGGGASANGWPSGAGGRGGDGLIVVISW